MRILVVGNGAREDALVWRLAQSESCDAVFSTPGNAGTAARGENWGIAATDSRKIVERAKGEKIDLVVLGPETAIAAGVGDKLREAGFAVFGPNRSGGRLESSKIFAKRFMERHGIPTARGRAVHSLDQALKVLEDWHGGVVIKADGLAAGKGVVVTDDIASARVVLRDWYDNKRIPGGGVDVLLEEKLIGREISVFAIADGRAMIPLAAACDYKRAGDGDTGPNTGGMGAYSPLPWLPVGFVDEVIDTIAIPTVRTLAAEQTPFIGLLYCGLIITESGTRVIEFNARFGDPETQVVLPRLITPLSGLLFAAASGELGGLARPEFSTDVAVTVVLASEGYPETPITGRTISGVNAALAIPGVTVAHAATALSGGALVAIGGRVLSIVATGSDFVEARSRAYLALQAIDLEGGQYRTDIALRVAE